jgi:cytochrome bd-type quinol oxidase subunit 2
LWLGLLLVSLATFAVGISGHIVALLGAPWLTLKTQAAIHTGIPVLLTAVKFVTVPVLLVLTPFARHHPTFEGWTDWSADRLRELESVAKWPFVLLKKQFCRMKSWFSPRGPRKD